MKREKLIPFSGNETDQWDAHTVITCSERQQRALRDTVFSTGQQGALSLMRTLDETDK